MLFSVATEEVDRALRLPPPCEYPEKAQEDFQGVMASEAVGKTP